MGRREEELHNFGEFVRHISIESVQYLKKVVIFAAVYVSGKA